MEHFGVLLWDMVITIFSFFVAAPMLLNAISVFGVQKRFAQVMIDEGVIDAAEVKALQPKKQLAGVLIAAVCLSAVCLTAYRAGTYGWLCLLLGFVLGLLKYRQILQFNSLTVKRFQNNYRGSYNTEKLNRYIAAHF